MEILELVNVNEMQILNYIKVNLKLYYSNYFAIAGDQLGVIIISVTYENEIGA